MPLTSKLLTAEPASSSPDYPALYRFTERGRSEYVGEVVLVDSDNIGTVIVEGASPIPTSSLYRLGHKYENFTHRSDFGDCDRLTGKVAIVFNS